MLTIVQDKKKLTSDSCNFDMTCLGLFLLVWLEMEAFRRV